LKNLFEFFLKLRTRNQRFTSIILCVIVIHYRSFLITAKTIAFGAMVDEK